METYKDYIKRTGAETQGQLQKQSAINADVAANALESAAIAATNTHAEATSGGMIDSNIQPENITAARDMQAQQEAAQQATQGQADRQEDESAPEPIVDEPSGTIDPDLQKAQDDYQKEQDKIDEETRELNNQRIRMFSDMIKDQYDRQKREEQEMHAREKANTMSSMATGATEVAAGIINMLSVGENHASNQIYRSRSQDWMRKADQDMREHRHRRDNLLATMDRLKMQQEQVRTASRVEDMKIRQQKAQAELAKAQAEYNRKMKEQAERDALVAAMKAKGFIPDENDPSGWSRDPEYSVRNGRAKSPASDGQKPSAPSTKVGGEIKPNSYEKEKPADGNTINYGHGRMIPADDQPHTNQKLEERKPVSLADELRGL